MNIDNIFYSMQNLKSSGVIIFEEIKLKALYLSPSQKLRIYHIMSAFYEIPCIFW